MRFFELRKTLETTVRSEEPVWVVRLELYQALDDPRWFRARAFEYESFRLIPTTPQNDRGEPEDRCDDDLAAERSYTWLDRCCGVEFEAGSLEEALQLMLDDFSRASRGEFHQLEQEPT